MIKIEMNLSRPFPPGSRSFDVLTPRPIIRADFWHDTGELRVHLTTNLGHPLRLSQLRYIKKVASMKIAALLGGGE